MSLCRSDATVKGIGNITLGAIDEVAIWSVALDEDRNPKGDGSGVCRRASKQVTDKLGCNKRRVLKNA